MSFWARPSSKLSTSKAWLTLGAVLVCAGFPLAAQERAGELRLLVSDASGAGVEAHGELASLSNRFTLHFETSGGEYTAKKLPFGSYKLNLSHSGFAPYSTLVEIHSELSLKFPVTLGVATVTQNVVVRDADTLLDTTNTGASYQLGETMLRDWAASTPGRQVEDVVQSQPGWLLEANGVLHPRGAEYDTQYVVDGLPILNNRSPAFAPAQDLDEVQSVKTYTSGIPAEYGRKLGGVVETVTDRNPARGFHGTAVAGGGSFGTIDGFFGGRYATEKNVFALAVDGAGTDRYLDPPVVANFTNRATLSGIRGSWERDLTENDRLRFAVIHGRAGFLVPNEQLQQSVGQRQDRSSEETSGQISYQHIFSPRLLGSVQGRVRDLEVTLQSNPASTPIAAFQDRGFREGYVSASLDATLKHHELKAGADFLYSSVRENFSYLITATEINGQPIFDPATPLSFDFHQTAPDREPSFYVQDQAQFGNLNISAGLRYDHYSLRVADSAWSPRLGVAWFVPKLGVVLRASYDRIFGTPAVENLLLSTSAQVRTLNPNVAQLPLRPSRGDYYEVGATKELFRTGRISANYYRREIRKVADDDTLLNTGVSFPVALHSASIYGAESQLAFPQWGAFSAWLNYSYLVGSARLPVVGGLFLGNDAAALLNSNARIWVTQDQRHTVHAQVRYQPVSRFWTALSASYGTGLPVDLNGEDYATLVQQYGQAVVDRVNLDRGRVRPWMSLDLSAGVEVWRKESRSVRLQADARNLTNQLNVINFASLFSGTALAPPRSYSARLRFEF